MYPTPIRYLLLSLLLIGLSTPRCMAQGTAIASLSQFSVPLTTGGTGTAILIPNANGPAWLLISGPTGQIGLYQLTTSPTPQPPTPPEPPKPVAAAVITVTESDPAKLPTDVAALLSATRATFHAFTIAMVAEPEPPADALAWIGRTAGKPYPYSFVVAADGSILWQGPTPKDSAAWLSVLKPFAATTTNPTTLPAAGCNCPKEPTP
jgi:hypothetical protein